MQITFFDEGVNRIWYRPSNFLEGLEVKIRLWDPDLMRSLYIDFTELEEGLYYLDYSFNKRGPWVGIIYENDTKITSTTFTVGMRRPGIVRYNQNEHNSLIS